MQVQVVREGVGAVLQDLGVRELVLLTNNPAKVAALREHGIEVPVVEPLRIPPLASNAAYLRTKRDRMGHDLDIDTTPTDASGPAASDERITHP